MRLTTLEDRLARRLATIPLEAQRLCRLRSSLVARYSRSQPGELGAAAARFGGLGSTDGGTGAAVVDLCAVASDVKRQCARANAASGRILRHGRLVRPSQEPWPKSRSHPSNQRFISDRSAFAWMARTQARR